MNVVKSEFFFMYVFKEIGFVSVFVDIRGDVVRKN